MPTQSVAGAVLGSAGSFHVVLGAPGTGKTTVAATMVLEHVRAGGRAEECLVLTPSRQGADRVRSLLDAGLPGVTTSEVARTWSALAFELLQRRARLLREPAPRLLSGPEQDVLLAELLAGHAARGTGPAWPEALRLAVTTRGFRDELRDLLMRAAELGLAPEDLAALGAAQGREEWVAAAQVYDEYLAVTALSEPPGFDPAWLLLAAGDALDPPDGAEPAETDLARAVVGQVRLVVVDDAQELSHSAARLVSLLAAGGARVVLVGDADAATEGFRGGDASLMAALGRRRDARVHVLQVGYRVPTAVAELADRVAAHLPAPGGAPQRARRSPEGGAARVEVLRSESGQAVHVAATLRRWHLLDGVPYDDMAVILRGRAAQDSLRRTLGMYGVPLEVVGGGIALRDEPAVWPLLLAFRVSLAMVRGEEGPLSPADAEELLGSVVGRAGAVDLRRLRRVLRREARDGQVPDLPALLVDAALHGGDLPLRGPEAEPARRVARVLRAGVEAARVENATAHEVLWAIWSAAGLQDEWRAAALGGGEPGRRADADLDAVVALMRSAELYVERLPREAPETFLQHLLGQDLAADNLAARAQTRGRVTLTTPQGAAGRGWRRVMVVGVQEGLWPDLRLRGSLLGSQELVDLVLGRDGSVRARQAATRADELRSFHVALTRASEELVVTAVAGRDLQPSAFLDLVDPLPPEAAERTPTEVQVPLSPRALVGRSRRELWDEGTRDAAAARLAALADVVPGADPAQWWALREVTSIRDLVPGDAPVRVSPSRVEAYTACPLRWLLQSRGGEAGGITAASIGTLVHAVIEANPHAMAATLQEDLRREWAALGLGDGWQEERALGRAEAMLETYVAYRDDATVRGWTLAGSELGIDLRVGRAHVVGRVDRVETDGRGGVRVVDFKTGSSKVSAAAAQTHPQLGIYQLAVEQDGVEACPAGPGTSRGALLLYLSAPTVRGAVRVQEPPGDDFFARPLVEDAAEGMAVGTQYATPAPDVCRSCPVHSSCPAQPEGEELA